MDDVFLSIFGYDLGMIWINKNSVGGLRGKSVKFEDTLTLVVFVLFNIHITLASAFLTCWLCFQRCSCLESIKTFQHSPVA